MPVASKNSTRRKKVLSADVSGVILAGGKSSRYGANKAFVEVDGIPLIERVAGILQSIFEQTVIVTNSPEEYSYLNMPMRRDIIPGLGPLGGIFTGLQMISGKAGFFVACDMPFLNPDLIRYMVGIKDAFDVVVPKITWKMEALHAMYGTKCTPHIEKLIHSENFQIVRLFKYVSVRYVGEDEIMQFDPELKSFFNINRPEEIRNMEKPGRSHEKERRYRKRRQV